MYRPRSRARLASRATDWAAIAVDFGGPQGREGYAWDERRSRDRRRCVLPALT